MRISAVLPQSTLDYPDKLCAVIFVSPCNFRCGYCQNPTLVTESKKTVSDEEVLALIKQQSSLIDAVTITGGEPTIQPDLVEFCKKLKALGVYVKVDTNGSNPAVLDALIDGKVVDYIAMDLKATFSLYNSVAAVEVDIWAIRESISILLRGKVSYEFRTTIIPLLITEARLEEMLNEIRGARLFALQQFHNVVVLDGAYKFMEPYPRKRLEDFEEIALKYVEKVEIRA